MIRITLTPRQKCDTFALLTRKELELRRKKQGTLHKSGLKKAGQVKWVHRSYPGWIRMQRSLGGVTVAIVQSKREGGENQLLASFVGFVDRHFHDQISGINISYDSDG
ncbi:MAG: hypothetical protein WD063_20760 [Pirellulales bacterium]